MFNNNSEVQDVLETTSIAIHQVEDLDYTSPCPANIWEKHLMASKYKVGKDVDTESLAILFPLSETEIISVIGFLNNNHPGGELSQQTIIQSVLTLLGGDRLASRLDVMRTMYQDSQYEVFACAAAKDACGNPHECGQPYHCGPDFACGTPFECSTPFEFTPCVSSEIHCAKHDHNIDNPD